MRKLNLQNIQEYDNDTLFQRPDKLHGPLYVMTVVFNPARYRSRWKLYQDFKLMVEATGSVLLTAEIALGDREFVLTQKDDPNDLQLRTHTELWHKENALNLLLHKLISNYPDAEHIATIDADVSFIRGDWANETKHKLQHYDIVQMWSEAQDLSPEYEVLSKHHSFVYSWFQNEPVQEDGGYYGGVAGQPKVFTWHPGWAWAYRRSALEALSGFIEVGILGANDNHQAKCLVGDGDKSLHPSIQGDYRRLVLKWEQRALRYIKKNIGYVPGLINHFWHGKKVDRKYWDRWKILTENKYDPFNDLKLDCQGLFQLVVEDERQEKLRDQLRAYFKQRNEDSIDL